MDYRLLGDTGVFVSEICHGAMTFGGNTGLWSFAIAHRRGGKCSLSRLGTDYIDLYQIHRPDDLASLEDTVRALDEMVRAGKVRYIGCSNLPAWKMMKALAISREQPGALPQHAVVLLTARPRARARSGAPRS
jgi:aryl-alcohol dehydrogenase-like predicted oxidoreductase